MIKNNEKLVKFFGVLKDVDWKTREKEMQSLRDDFEERLS